VSAGAVADTVIHSGNGYAGGGGHDDGDGDHDDGDGPTLTRFEIQKDC
jgi:hypothetical protein